MTDTFTPQYNLVTSIQFKCVQISATSAGVLIDTFDLLKSAHGHVVAHMSNYSRHLIGHILSIWLVK